MVDISKKIEEIQTDLAYALKEYGEYTFWDKGSGEVIDLSSYRRDFATMTPEEVAEIVVTLHESDNEFQQTLAKDFIGEMQEMPDEWWESLMEQPGVDEIDW